MKRLMCGLAVGALAVAGVAVAGGPEFESAQARPSLAVSAAATGPTALDLVVMPHPDDEMQAWSLVENTPDKYKVFMFMTRGNGTGACRGGKALPAFNANLGEIDPRPGTRVTFPFSASECATLRMKTTIGFLNAMSAKDSTLPTKLRRVGTVKLPTPVGVPLVDGDSTVEVYDGGKYGKVLFFNIHDGRVAKPTAEWAIRSVLDHKSLFGLPTRLPVRDLLGPFANVGYRKCATYPHPDHIAVHQALYHTNFKVSGAQIAATCATDSDAVIRRTVSAATWDYAFTVEARTQQRRGVFERYYGWLNGTYLGGWPDIAAANSQLLNGKDPKAPFMRAQSFWRRF